MSENVNRIPPRGDTPELAVLATNWPSGAIGPVVAVSAAGKPTKMVPLMGASLREQSQAAKEGQGMMLSPFLSARLSPRSFERYHWDRLAIVYVRQSSSPASARPPRVDGTAVCVGRSSGGPGLAAGAGTGDRRGPGPEWAERGGPSRIPAIARRGRP